MNGLTAFVVVLCSLQCSDAAVTGWTGAVTSTTLTADGTYATAISENAAVGTSLFTVTATTGLTSGITWTYTLTTGGTKGQITDATKGVVTVKAALDFETSATETFVIEADDGSGTKGTASVTVKLIDEPALEYTAYAICLADKTAGGSTVVTASSSTSGVTYTLTGNDAGKFDISSGKITLKSTETLAYSTKDSYVTTITGTLASETSATPLKLYVCTVCSSSSAAMGLSILTSVVVLAAAATKLI